ncbi:MAG: hypothetical protein JO152_05645, partial [Mycobacteriaceae bacterium]|nr:hypothetical protein [Mycobacteriaceae bacterium]
EWTDVDFALVAIEIRREARQSKRNRTKRQCVRWLIVSGVVLVMVNLLSCMAYLIFSLIGHMSPL